MMLGGYMPNWGKKKGISLFCLMQVAIVLHLYVVSWIISAVSYKTGTSLVHCINAFIDCMQRFHICVYIGSSRSIRIFSVVEEGT